MFFILFYRWSVIAAKLPGRTDNEIKNVWHTHLKKRLESHQTNTNVSKKRYTESISASKTLHFEELDISQSLVQPDHKSPSEKIDISNEPSSSESSSVTEATANSYGVAKHEDNDHEAFIDDSFWSEALSGDDNFVESNLVTNIPVVESPTLPLTLIGNQDISNQNIGCDTNDMGLWYDIFTRIEELPDLPEF